LLFGDIQKSCYTKNTQPGFFDCTLEIIDLHDFLPDNTYNYNSNIYNSRLIHNKSKARSCSTELIMLIDVCYIEEETQ